MAEILVKKAKNPKRRPASELLQDSDLFTSDFQPMVKSIFWSTTGFYFLGFVIPQFAEMIGVQDVQLGLIYSFITIGNIISAPIVGFLADKISKKVLGAFGVFGRGLSYFVMYLAILLRSYVLFVISCIILGFVVSFFWIPFNQLIAQKSHHAHRSFAYSQRASAVGKGGLVGGIIGFGLFIVGQKFQFPIYLIYSSIILFAGANFYAGYLFLRAVDEDLTLHSTEVDSNPILITTTEKETKKGKSPIPKMLLIGLIFIMLSYFIGSINSEISKPFLQTFIMRTVTDDPTLIILIFMPSSILPMLLAPKLGSLVERINIYWGLIAAALLGALLTFFLINVQNMILFSFLLIFDTAVAISQSLILDKFVSRISREHRGKLFGSRLFFANIGAALGPILGGIVWRLYSIKMPFIISIVVEVALIPLFFIAIKKTTPFLEEK
ncbi:MFS transporter [Candidatus Lokiarchaeum ossiferum]|uniref:MFS transporter n=1 Tax=Candidatus Lokiarchaeum ossiferum TaxID=2951803 RepID=UPI00352E810F